MCAFRSLAPRCFVDANVWGRSDVKAARNLTVAAHRVVVAKCVRATCLISKAISGVSRRCLNGSIILQGMPAATAWLCQLLLAAQILGATASQGESGAEHEASAPLH